MKVLQLTDTHLGLPLKAWAHPKGWTRAQDLADAMELALQPAFREEVDLVVHSGDLFDRAKPSPEAVVFAAKQLTRAARRVPVVIMPGNHDSNGLGKLLQHAENVHIVDEPKQLRFGDLVLGLVPFERDPKIWAHDAESVADGATVLVAHQSFAGARVPGFTFRVGRPKETIGAIHLPEQADIIMCGHIHRRQVTRLAHVRVVQPGSTERTSFTEEFETKGYALWHFEDTPSWHFVDLPSRPMVRLRNIEDLARITPGTIVLMDKTSSPDWVDPVAQLGGWFVGRRPRRMPTVQPTQLGLFG